jgi:hypothetical protein
MYNVCNKIECPYSSKNGCSRYVISNHCHLLYPEQGCRREGLEPNQYWLYARENDNAVDINQLKIENQSWLETDETTQRKIELQIEPFDVGAKCRD